MQSSGDIIGFRLYKNGVFVADLDHACRHVTGGNGGNAAYTFRETASATTALNYQLYWRGNTAGSGYAIGINNYAGTFGSNGGKIINDSNGDSRMSSILKVDQIQLSNGNTPTIGDLGLNDTFDSPARSQTVTNTGTAPVIPHLPMVANWNINITPKSSSNILGVSWVNIHSGIWAGGYYARYRFFNTTDNAAFHDNTHIGHSHYNVSSAFWQEVPLWR